MPEERLNLCLIGRDLPFPAFANLTDEHELIFSDLARNPFTRVLSALNPFRRSSMLDLLNASFNDELSSVNRFSSRTIVTYFKRHESTVFRSLIEFADNESQRAMIEAVAGSYRHRNWASCCHSVFPLLDSTIRRAFCTDHLQFTLQVFRDAFFRHAQLDINKSAPKSCSIDPDRSPYPFSSPILDLRLLGVYLASFLEMANRIYQFYECKMHFPVTIINRHAAIHGAPQQFSQDNAIRLIIFLDLTIRLRPVLMYFATGERECLTHAYGRDPHPFPVPAITRR